MSKEKIKNCPFCGSTAAAIKHHYNHRVECQNCFAKTMTTNNPAAAISLWNQRPFNQGNATDAYNTCRECGSTMADICLDCLTETEGRPR